MERKIDKVNFVEPALIKTYQEINGFDVIEELLLFKGVEIAGSARAVHKKYLDDAALILYGLKVNATNLLYVGMQLDKFYQRNGLVCDSGRVKVPKDIYDKVKALNDSYKTKDNQIEE